MTTDSGNGPLPLVWQRVHRTAWLIQCSNCGTELVQAPDLPDGLHLAHRNATARPCCPAWRDIDPPTTGPTTIPTTAEPA